MPATRSDPRPPARTGVTAAEVAPRTVVGRLAGGAAVVLLLLAAGHVLFLLVPSVRPLSIFDLAEESSFGTWVGSSMHLVCAALSVACGMVARRDRTRPTTGWWLLAAVFLVMSADETAAAHDRLVAPLQYRFATSGVLLYPWVVVGLVLAGLFLLLQLRFLRSLGRTGVRLVLAGAVFVAGAAGLEMVEGVVASPGGPGSESLLYGLLVLVEELMEVGALMWVAGILVGHLVASAGAARSVLAPGASPAVQLDRVA